MLINKYSIKGVVFMKCQNCGEEEANIKYYENINGEKREILICSNCAKSLNLMDFPNMLSYFFNNYPKEVMESEYTKKVCDKCSYTFDDYLKNGLFGCPNCYNAFSDRIDALLTKIHGKNRHITLESKTRENNINVDSSKKIRTSVKQNNIQSMTDINKLKNLLSLSIKEEKYEDAAKIRDRLKELEK
jgi:protein arginine kinase activator